MSDQEVVLLYVQSQYVPNTMLLLLFPELNEPSGELQYQLLKIEYRLLEVSGGLSEAFDKVCQLVNEPMQSLADAFKKLSDELFEFEDFELFYDQKHSVFRYNTNTKKFYYKYKKDIRNEIRRYIRNHVY